MPPSPAGHARDPAGGEPSASDAGRHRQRQRQHPDQRVHRPGDQPL